MTQHFTDHESEPRCVKRPLELIDRRPTSQFSLSSPSAERNLQNFLGTPSSESDSRMNMRKNHKILSCYEQPTTSCGDDEYFYDSISIRTNHKRTDSNYEQRSGHCETNVYDTATAEIIPKSVCQNSILCDCNNKCNRGRPERRVFVSDTHQRRAIMLLHLFLLLPINTIFVQIAPSAYAMPFAQAQQQQQRPQRQQRQQQHSVQNQQPPQTGSGPNIQLEYAGGKYLEPHGDQFHLICASSAPLKEWLRNDVSLYVAPPEMLRTLRQQNVWTDTTNDKGYSIRVERNMQNHAVSPYKSTLTSGTRLDGVQFGGNYTCVTGDQSGNIAQHMTHHVNVLNQWNAVEAEALRYVSDTEELQLPPDNTATLPNGDVVMVLDRDPGKLDHDIELKCDCQLNPCPGNISWTHFDRKLLNGDWYSPFEYQQKVSQRQEYSQNNNRLSTMTTTAAPVVDEETLVRVVQKHEGVSKLIIPIFHFDDLGVYKCQLDTSDVSRTLQSITRAITIYMPPVVNIVMPNNIVRGDEDVAIRCEVSGYPKPNVRWQAYSVDDDTVLDPQPIELVLPNITINTTDRGWRYPESSEPWIISTILIPKATDEHNRKLVCIAENTIPVIHDREAYAPRVQSQQLARALRIRDPNNYLLPAAIIACELVAVTLCIWCCGRCDIDEGSTRPPPPEEETPIVAASRTPHGNAAAADGTAGEMRPLYNSGVGPSSNNNRPGVVRHTGPDPNTHEYIFVPDERGGEIRPASSSSLHHQQNDQFSSQHHRAHA